MITIIRRFQCESTILLALAYLSNDCISEPFQIEM